MVLRACPISLGFGSSVAVPSTQVGHTILPGEDITIHRGDTFVIQLTGLGDISDRTKLWFTVKRDRNKTDAQSKVQVEETAGLLRLEGLAPASSAHATLFVDDEVDGDVTITIVPTATFVLREGVSFVYDMQVLRDTGTINTLTDGRADVDADVTQAVT